VGWHHIARKFFRIHHALENWLSENYRNLSEFWRQTAAQLFYDRFRSVFGANMSFAAVSEVFWELIAPNLMLFR
jgi:hypothetical protein